VTRRLNLDCTGRRRGDVPRTEQDCHRRQSIFVVVDALFSSAAARSTWSRLEIELICRRRRSITDRAAGDRLWGGWMDGRRRRWWVVTIECAKFVINSQRSVLFSRLLFSLPMRRRPLWTNFLTAFYAVCAIWIFISFLRQVANKIDSVCDKGKASAFRSRDSSRQLSVVA